MKRRQSHELYSRALRVAPGGVHSPVRAATHSGGEPVFVEHARGARITDADNNSYTDYCMAFGPLILGHQHPTVTAAARAALDEGWSYGTAERYSLELAELIIDHVPDVEQIRFVNSGTEAVMTALRLARAATGRDRVLKFTGCYHGHTDAMLIEAGSGMSGESMSAGIPAAIATDTLVGGLDDSAGLQQIFAAAGDEIAAAIIEPLPANFGLLPQRPEFLKELQQLCRRHGALLICDEVISGFRTSFAGYSSTAGIQPDLLTWGKIIGGGFPVGAIAGSAALMQRLAPTGDVYQAGTLSANPLAMRAGRAALECLTDGAVYAELEKLGERLEAGVNAIPGFGITRVGSVFRLGNEQLRSGLARDTRGFEESACKDFPAVYDTLLKQGIYIAPSPYEVGFLSAAHTAADIDHFIAALERCQSE